MIMAQLLDQINAQVHKQMDKIVNKTQAVLKQEIWASPEIQELSSSGKLAAVLGLDRGSEYPRVSAIVDKVVSQTRVTVEQFRFVSGQTRGNVTISILPLDYRELLSIPEATLNAPDWEFPFLKWLLQNGDRIIVESHGTLYLPTKDFAGSRSGGAIQIKSPTQNAKLIWRVPPVWAGTSENNLLTRSIQSDSFRDQLFQILISSIL